MPRRRSLRRKFPENGSGFANLGGHFLPYDAGNFEFSSKPGLTEADQELALYNLNQNILNAGATQAQRGTSLPVGTLTGLRSTRTTFRPAGWQPGTVMPLIFTELQWRAAAAPVTLHCGKSTTRPLLQYRSSVLTDGGLRRCGLRHGHQYLRRRRAVRKGPHDAELTDHL
jgi:hypothetical protein